MDSGKLSIVDHIVFWRYLEVDMLLVRGELRLENLMHIFQYVTNKGWLEMLLEFCWLISFLSKLFRELPVIQKQKIPLHDLISQTMSPCHKLLLQLLSAHVLHLKLLKFKDQDLSSVIWLRQSLLYSNQRQWAVVISDSYGLLLKQSLLQPHLRCSFIHLLIMWNQAFFCLCQESDCGVSQCLLDCNGLLLRQRWLLCVKNPIFVGCHVLLQGQSQDYGFIKHMIVAYSGWFVSILELLYCSLARPPEDFCDFGWLPNSHEFFKSKMQVPYILRRSIR